ncbi:TIGR00730 family Rossman fold protein [Thalassotalea sp. LPB0316]|uniref:LOG family protein n=1 Tax=Thalassotalea sp. LPB0316 TaxID=2769490 RepID=UPI001867A770|nr:TIGR00730 family Rossman fold protein [Thalassotalea sp. LPB0316]QOL25965.1 TIGR00730 family Rossman fold protein [Thalassotalea sp. LPB0316]
MNKNNNKKSIFPSAHDDLQEAKLNQLTHSSYSLAYADDDFLLRDELRAVRLQLEWLKPDMILQEHDIHSTVVIFGGARFSDPEKCHESDPSKQAKCLENSRYYPIARTLAQRITELSLEHKGQEYVIVTGGGPGIMEAANRGATDVGGKSVGLNIVLPKEQQPNPYITPELCFQFHYFAMRKMHFLKRACGLVAFPGGFGTLDELFETLTLIQTKKIKPVPVILINKSYWQNLINFDFLVEQGAICPEDAKLISWAETAEEAYGLLDQHWREQH